MASSKSNALLKINDENEKFKSFDNYYEAEKK